MIRELSAQLMARHDPRHDVVLQFEDLAIAVRTNSAALHRRLADCFRAFRRGDEPRGALRIVALQAAAPHLDVPLRPQPRPEAARQLKEAFADVADGRIVRKVHTGMVFLCGGDLGLAVGPCETNANQVINFINSRYVRWRLAACCCTRRPWPAASRAWCCADSPEPANRRWPCSCCRPSIASSSTSA